VLAIAEFNKPPAHAVSGKGCGVYADRPTSCRGFWWMQDESFGPDWLCPRLRARLKEVPAAEYLARWAPDYERVKAVRDALAAEMRETNPAAVAQLVDLFQRMAECDRS
jgi:hypothetical protein